MGSVKVSAPSITVIEHAKVPNLYDLIIDEPFDVTCDTKTIEQQFPMAAK